MKKEEIHQIFQIKNWTGKVLHVPVAGRGNAFIEIEPETSQPLIKITKVTRVQALINVATTNGIIQIPIYGNEVSLKCEGAVPSPNGKVLHVITEEMEDAFRKGGRVLRDCVVARRSAHGYYYLESANFIALLAKNYDTTKAFKAIESSMCYNNDSLEDLAFLNECQIESDR